MGFTDSLVPDTSAIVPSALLLKLRLELGVRADTRVWKRYESWSHHGIS